MPCGVVHFLAISESRLCSPDGIQPLPFRPCPAAPGRVCGVCALYPRRCHLPASRSVVSPTSTWSLCCCPGRHLALSCPSLLRPRLVPLPGLLTGAACACLCASFHSLSGPWTISLSLCSSSSSSSVQRPAGQPCSALLCPPATPPPPPLPRLRRRPGRAFFSPSFPFAVEEAESLGQPGPARPCPTPPPSSAQPEPPPLSVLRPALASRFSPSVSAVARAPRRGQQRRAR